ncbi:MAG TPA: hypothetical protein VG168_15245 [Bryobacteraceae bacterium]|nr:hypothetical protein [Bryobacteraceae bacterium]
MRVSLVHMFTVAAMFALTGTATMQAAEQARFHLSTPAHWGHAVLPPGDYKVLLPAPAIGQMAFRVDGPSKSMYEFPLSADKSRHYSAYSYLKLSEVDGSYFIRELSLGPSGKTFTFSVPKSAYHQQMTNGRDSRVALSVR